MLLLATAVTGCLAGRISGPRSTAARIAALVAGPPLSPEAVWVLERGGPGVADTTVTLSRRQGRRIIMRYPAPDYDVFLLLDIPADSTAALDDSLRIDLRPVPREYSVTIDLAGTLTPATTLSFSYARHFGQPTAALATYPSARTFEEALLVVRHADDGRLIPLGPQRPASDVLRSTLTGPGRYTVVAPRRLPT